VHITNYQNRYYGGAAMIRLYHFDLQRNTIDVETVAPWFLEIPAAERNLLAAQEARLTTATDYFSVQIDFAQRFSGFDPIPVRPARPAKARHLPPGSSGARLAIDALAALACFSASRPRRVLGLRPGRGRGPVMAFRQIAMPAT